jgi:hypothetical protein
MFYCQQAAHEVSTVTTYFTSMGFLNLETQTLFTYTILAIRTVREVSTTNVYSLAVKNPR